MDGGVRKLVCCKSNKLEPLLSFSQEVLHVLLARLVVLHPLLDSRGLDKDMLERGSFGTEDPVQINGLEKHFHLKRLAAIGEMKKAFGLTKVNGNHKGLDAAIVKATSYRHTLPKEKHIRTIFQSLSPSKPRSEVVYCIHSLLRRLNHTNNWAVALKALVVIHRAMRELDNTVWGELVNYTRGNGALDYSAWIRNYALYLEERLQCFVIVNYDVGTYSSKLSQKLDTQELLVQLPSLQNLLFRLLDCKPTGFFDPTFLHQIAGESVKLYVAITVKIVTLLDKFFEMHRDDATRALEIYQKSGSQAERLSAFFEACRGLDFGRGQKFINIKTPPASFMSTMEEYIKDAPSTLMLEDSEKVDDKGEDTANESAAAVDDLLIEVDEEANAEDKSDKSPEKKNEANAPTQAADLMGLYDLLTGASEFEENSLTLAIVPTEKSPNSSIDDNGSSSITGWEDALFTEPEISNENNAGALDVLNLDGLYENAITMTQQNGAYQIGQETDVLNLDGLYENAITVTQQNGAYQIGQEASNPFDFGASNSAQFNMAIEPSILQNESYAPPPMTTPIPDQMVGVPYQDYYMMHHQQMQEPLTMNNKTTNPFDEPNTLPPDMPSLPTQSA
ncbi:hypothetical protein RIF29_09682 [Crotalaria pallida]|uniref:ENTH domain-containing protein n=1 Tax=Crotalaria pallida TaxID=3830 RepID=A0AAN9FUY3_CROPI